MITLILIAITVGVVVTVIITVYKFISYATKLFDGGSLSQTDTDPHTYVDARKLPRSSKKSSHESKMV